MSALVNGSKLATGAGTPSRATSFLHTLWATSQAEVNRAEVSTAEPTCVRVDWLIQSGKAVESFIACVHVYAIEKRALVS